MQVQHLGAGPGSPAYSQYAHAHLSQATRKHHMVINVPALENLHHEQCPSGILCWLGLSRLKTTDRFPAAGRSHEDKGVARDVKARVSTTKIVWFSLLTGHVEVREDKRYKGPTTICVTLGRRSPDTQALTTINVQKATRPYHRSEKAMDENLETALVVIVIIAVIVGLFSAGRWCVRPNPRMGDPLA